MGFIKWLFGGEIALLKAEIYALDLKIAKLSDLLATVRSKVYNSGIHTSNKRGGKSMQEEEENNKPSNADALFFKMYPQAKANPDFARASFEYRQFMEGNQTYNNDQDDDDEEEE